MQITIQYHIIQLLNQCRIQILKHLIIQVLPIHLISEKKVSPLTNTALSISQFNSLFLCGRIDTTDALVPKNSTNEEARPAPNAIT